MGMTGVTTIDPDAAARDIRNMTSRVQLLSEMRRRLRLLNQQAQTMRGDTGTAIVEKSQELLNRTASAETGIQDAIQFIRMTVWSYEEKDDALANVIRHGGGGRRF